KKQLLGLFSLFCGFFLYWVGHSILKPIFGIPRPVDFFGKARVIGPWDPSSFSFPSTTTMLAFGVAFAIFLKERKIGSFLLILALLLGLALIYAGFHTPLDVLGGILFSLLFVLVIEKFVNWKNEK
ncbi:phosphatase PAP2 family protein, partial [Candidatus Parcubacteria bacterium]|nr:phosphatase PAP2 family protein [Candidatus Parcubacteria bacterium]